MTKTKKEKEVKEKEDQKENEKSAIKSEEDKQENKEEEEIKLIEEKEGAKEKLLEYFSKEDLVDEVKKMEKIINAYEEKITDLNKWRKKYIHLQAEFENAQKRWDKSRQDLRTQYTASVIKDFLPLYDSFKKAIENAKEDDHLKQFYNQFMNILKSQRAEVIGVKINDKFDYNFHEALSSLEKDDLPENSIVDIIQDGWKLGKDVLRYTKVVISKKPKPPEPEPVAESESNNEPKKEEAENDKTDEEPMNKSNNYIN